MRTRYTILIIACLLFLSLSVPSLFSLLYAADNTKNVSGWSYSIVDGIEKSIRSYLLVANPENPDRRQLSVVSACQKPYRQEGVYGQCKHTITTAPTGSQFTVITGEDVLMIATAWETPLVVGTLNYGCCAEPFTIDLYREDGQRLGMLKKTHRSLSSLYGNAITRTWALGNSTGRHEKIQYFVIQDDQKEDLFFAIRKSLDGKTLKIPIQYKNTDQSFCEEWYLGKFVKYGDRNDITLSLEGFYCNNKEGYKEKLFSCLDQEKAIECKER